MCIRRRPFLGNFLISGSHFLKPATYNHEMTQATKGLWNGGLILSKKKYFKLVVKSGLVRYKADNIPNHFLP